jgi:hemerythrin superfamily protein
MLRGSSPDHWRHDMAAQDAISLLKADHRKVEDLFSDYESAEGPAAKRKLAHRICLELSVHTRIEEEIFYPACKGKIDGDLLSEGYVEHDGAKVLIAEIEHGDPTDAFYDAKVSVLAEMIKHHVQEEEAFLRGMFSQARRSDVDMDVLGSKLASQIRAGEAV